MSSTTTLARPYAKATFEVAHGRDALVPWAQALAFAASVAAHERVRRLIGDPMVDNAELAGLFVPEDGAPEGFEGFLKLLVDNDRLALLPEINAGFEALKAQAEGTLSVTVRSARAMDEGDAERFSQVLAKRFGKRIDLSVEVQPELLGGAVIQAGDTVIDGSLRGKLTRLAENLTQ